MAQGLVGLLFPVYLWRAGLSTAPPEPPEVTCAGDPRLGRHGGRHPLDGVTITDVQTGGHPAVQRAIEAYIDAGVSEEHGVGGADSASATSAGSPPKSGLPGGALRPGFSSRPRRRSNPPPPIFVPNRSFGAAVPVPRTKTQDAVTPQPPTPALVDALESAAAYTYYSTDEDPPHSLDIVELDA
jgi:hypothetical protein